MFLHLAETSSSRGQYQLLLALKHRNHLISYAYRSTAIPAIEPIWSAMHLHFAGNGLMAARAKESEGANTHLISYAYPEEIGKHQPLVETQSGARVIIDSGAFTAHTTGKKIQLEQYAEFAHDLRGKWVDKLTALHFMNLDVIGDQSLSWQNQAKLEQLGVNPIPIITRGSSLEDLHRSLEYPYIALGGLVGVTRQELQVWFDRCFRVIMEHRRKTGIMPKVHLLGVTSEWALFRYPAYSSDSSSWVRVLRFGDASAAGLKRVPRLGDGDTARAANMHVLRSEIRKFQKLEHDATQLWKARGVEWGEPC